MRLGNPDGEIDLKVGAKQIAVCCDDCGKKARENPAKHVGNC